MSKGKLTMQEEYEKKKAAFNYGRPSIAPLSNKGLMRKKEIIEAYIEENNKAHVEINKINSKKKKSEVDKGNLVYWKARLDLHEKLGTSNKAFITLKRIDTELKNGLWDTDGEDHHQK